MRFAFAIVALLFLSGFAFATDWFVRPATQFENATENGTSFETAFDGFQKIVWGASGVKAGDTLYICGTFIYPVDFNYGSNQTLASGTADKHIIIRGNCPNNPGVIIAARKMLKASFTDLHDGSFSAPTGGYGGAYFWQGDPANSPILLRSYNNVNTPSEVANTDGSAWIDANARIMYVNPLGKLDDIYWNWTASWYNRGSDFIEYRNLRLFGGSGNDGGIRLVKATDPNPTPTSNISIIDSEIAFGNYTAVYAQGASTDNILIENVKIHDVTCGSYAIYGGGAAHNNWTFSKVEIYSGEQRHYNIFGNNDAHAIGGQNMSNLLIEDSNIHDWHGDGVIDYMGSTGKMENVTIRRNSFTNLNDDEGAHLHYGVAKHGTNAANFGSRSNNWQIYNNIFSNIGTKNNPETLGVGYAIRGKGDGGEVPAAIYNNVFHDVAGGIFWADLGRYENPPSSKIYYPHLPGGIGFTAKNNITLNPKSGGNFYYTPMPAVTSNNLIKISNNLYWPDTLSGNNKFRWLGKDSTNYADWVVKSGDSNSWLADPQLINASGSFRNPGDFQLKQGSQAINAGTDVGLTSDYAGNPIIDSPDIGAFEYSGSLPSCVLPQILCSSSCITPACSSNAACNDSNSLTTDTCNNPSNCTANCTHTPIPARTCFDLTLDLKVDVFDLVFVSLRLGNTTGDPADIIGNDGVNIQDLQEVAKHFGTAC
ncbi:MAG: right-handed parallel beta-helix repeat-containing protein [Candidatus Diapherotrites archaeon]|nr:right-handed parallel beta-helix repeat-containing protein [Candidatus Diapherotrites archaeon]